MSRWEPHARERLERAALELFTSQGFAETTVPQITARAGLTTRTYFRHFADKREVLFAGEDEIPTLVARLMADAPAHLTPMALVAQGLDTLAKTRFEGQREHLRTRRAVIASDESLRERELRKFSALTEVITDGFRRRGVEEVSATLAAHMGVTVFSVAVSRWLDETDGRSLPELVQDTLDAVAALSPAPTA